MAQPLLKVGCWEFQRPSLKQGAAGTVHFEPGGVFFWDCLAANRRAGIHNGCRLRFLCDRRNHGAWQSRRLRPGLADGETAGRNLWSRPRPLEQAKTFGAGQDLWSRPRPLLEPRGPVSRSDPPLATGPV
jgi:hypothetical protein